MTAATTSFVLVLPILPVMPMTFNSPLLAAGTRDRLQRGNRIFDDQQGQRRRDVMFGSPRRRDHGREGPVRGSLTDKVVTIELFTDNGDEQIAWLQYTRVSFDPAKGGIVRQLADNSGATRDQNFTEHDRRRHRLPPRRPQAAQRLA